MSGLDAIDGGDVRIEGRSCIDVGSRARTCDAPVDVIGIEIGLVHRLRKEEPGNTFVPLREVAICEYLKSITLPKLYRALRDDVYEVSVEPSIAAHAREAIDRMLAVPRDDASDKGWAAHAHRVPVRAFGALA